MSAASCSYHFRQLARYGFVDEAEPRHGRRRPWRATAQRTAWSEGHTSEQREAAAALTDVVLERYFERVQVALERRLQLSHTWREATTFADYDVHVTAAELRRLTDGIVGLVEAYAERTQRPELRPRGARPVMLIGFALPAGE